MEKTKIKTEDVTDIIPNNLKKFQNMLERNKSHIIKVSSIVLGTIVGALLLIMLLGLLVTNLITYIEQHESAFILIALIIGGIIWLFANKWRPNTKPFEPTIVYDNEIDEAMERTYVNIAQGIIWTLFIKAASVYPLIAPANTSDVYSPPRARKKDNIVYYEYAAVKTGDINISEVERFLQSELTRMLFDGETHGLPSNTKFIDGIELPILQVDNVKDVGSHILVSVVVSTEKYQKVIAYRTRTKLERYDTKDSADDDEFV